MKKDPIEELMYDYKTLSRAIKSLQEEIYWNRLMPTYNSMEEQIYSLDHKMTISIRMNDIISDLSDDLKLIWELRYMKDKDVDIICDEIHMSKSTYHRLRRKLREFIGKNLGYL